MLWWEDGFCRLLAEHGRFVIRYDHRDTGKSTTYEPGRPGYTGADLLADAIGVLDGYDLPAAHVVGVSAGGALRAAPCARLPRARALARPDQHVACDARRPEPAAAEQRVRAIRPLGDDGLVGCRLGDRLPRRLRARARGRSARLRGGRGRATSSGATSSAPTTSPRPRTTTSSQTTRRSASRSRRSRHRRWSSTAPPTPCSRSHTAKCWPTRSRMHGSMTLEGAGHGVQRADWEPVARAILQHTAGR